MPAPRALVTAADYRELVHDIDPSFADVAVDDIGPGEIQVTLRPTPATVGWSLNRLRAEIAERSMVNLLVTIKVLP